jgi:hypothetical protein
MPFGNTNPGNGMGNIMRSLTQKSSGVDEPRILDGIEGCWSYAKHILYYYRYVSKDHFLMYLKEIEYRFNHPSAGKFLNGISRFFWLRFALIA